MRKLVPLILLSLLLAFASCSDYSKAVKSTDIGYKYRAAVQYFEKPD